MRIEVPASEQLRDGGTLRNRQAAIEAHAPPEDDVGCINITEDARCAPQPALSCKLLAGQQGTRARRSSGAL